MEFIHPGHTILGGAVVAGAKIVDARMRGCVFVFGVSPLSACRRGPRVRSAQAGSGLGLGGPIVSWQ